MDRKSLFSLALSNLPMLAGTPPVGVQPAAFKRYTSREGRFLVTLAGHDSRRMDVVRRVLSSNTFTC